MQDGHFFITCSNCFFDGVCKAKRDNPNIKSCRVTVEIDYEKMEKCWTHEPVEQKGES